MVEIAPLRVVLEFGLDAADGPDPAHESAVSMQAD